MRMRCSITVFVVLLLVACQSKPGPEATATATAEAPAAVEAPAKTPLAAPAAPAVLSSAELGKPAPEFTLDGADGKTYSLADFKGKTVVLEWFNPDCPFVQHAHSQGELKSMAKRVMGEDLVWLSINSGAPGKQGHGAERNTQASIEYAMDNPILLDETGRAGRAYGAVKTPHLFVVNAAGLLVYRGGIDNAPIGKVDPARPRLPATKEDQLINYVDAALEDLGAQRALRLSDTPPYGCTVKYQS